MILTLIGFTTSLFVLIESQLEKELDRCCLDVSRSTGSEKIDPAWLETQLM